MRTAAYARYSTDSQREASLEDQLRNCRNYCTRMGWPEPVVFTDAAISGSRIDRNGYLQLMAQAKQFDAIIVDDLTRLGRDSEDLARAIKQMKFAGVRFIGVSDGVDTQRKGHKLEVGMRGLMAEAYIDDLAEKTHRGLTGRALDGASAGGLPFGYRITEVGHRMIDEPTAAIVRRIIAEYLAGQTPRQIAIALNRDGIRSPRGGTWSSSAIHGDTRRGIGILANPIYCGRQVWNRSRWVKHPDTRRRVRQERPHAEWIITEHVDLAIVDAATWDAVQRRLAGRSHATGQLGRPNRYLLSGILRCGSCGGAMVMVDAHSYGCSNARDRGTCPDRMRVKRSVAEHALLAGVREQLLTDAAFQRFQKAVVAEIKRQTPTADVARRELAQAELELANLVRAIKAGVLTQSTRTELLASEARVETAKRALSGMQQAQPAKILPRAREVWRGLVANLEHHARNLPAAREALRALIGSDVMVRKENGALVAEIAPHQRHLAMVAGARFVPYLTETLVIPLQQPRIVGPGWPLRQV